MEQEIVSRLSKWKENTEVSFAYVSKITKIAKIFFPIGRIKS